MKKLLFATMMVAGLAMTMSANAGGLGGALGGVGGAVGGLGGGIGGAVGGIGGAVGGIGGIGGAVGGSADAAVAGNISRGNIGAVGGNVGNVVSNVANFGISAGTTAHANAAVSANTRNEIRQIGALDGVSSVTFVDVNTLANAGADASLSDALSQDTGAAPKIQAALANNAHVMIAIMAENPDFDVSSVVAADVRANGELVIYTKG